MQQFGFLAPEFQNALDYASRAELAARRDPRAACFYARLALEVLIDWLYQRDATLRRPYENTLAARIYEPTFQHLLGSALVAKARIIKDLGNRAAHEARAISVDSALTALRELFHLSYWLARTYGRGPKPDAGLTFSPDAVPETRSVSVASLKQLQEAATVFTDAVAARNAEIARREASESERARIDAELKAARTEIEALKKANMAVLDTHDYSEAQTRDALIDLLLQEAGWLLTDAKDREFPVTGMRSTSGAGYVDYVLWGSHGKPLALLEAKRTRRDPQAGQQQAKLYADCLEKMYGQRPIIFYSNGYEHWMWDDARYPPRPVQGFLTKDELELAIARRTTRKALELESIDGKIVERPYQQRAIRRVTESFERDNLRKALLVMATGAGKTRTVIALCDLLMRANWAKRVLFLADRVALVNQAVNAFKAHLPSSSPVNLVTERYGHGRVYVSTYPTIMNLIEDTSGGVRRFGPGHFDLIVIDEAHRSVYRKFGAIFAYFDSLLVGLTATPKDEIDRDTYRLFELERGMPTDAYSLDEAVRDEYLVPPRSVSVPLKFATEGIRYDDLSDEEKAEWDDLEWSEDAAGAPDQVPASALNNWLFNADTVDKVLEYLMTHGIHVAAGDRIGKTIVFAKNHDHAQFIAQRFDVNYPHLRGSFCRVIDYATEHAQSLIDDFEQSEKPPHIAVSVDMLDTGIDIPDVVNLVFFKVIRSKTKFWQMIGRGTRLRPDLFGPGLDKEEFRVFDFCMNLEYFNQQLTVAESTISASLSKRLFMARVELVRTINGEIDERSSDRDLEGFAIAIAGRLRQEVAEMNLENFVVRPHRRMVEKYAEPKAWQHLAGDAAKLELEAIAGLPSALSDGDLPAKQFDLLMLRAQLALLRANASFATLRKRIVEVARTLEAISNVPMVHAELALILEVQSETFWESVAVGSLEHVRLRLRSLIKLIDIRRQPLVYSDFEDTIIDAREFSILPGDAPGDRGSIGVDFERFRARSRAFLSNHLDHLAIQKLRRNEPLTATDLAELERLFVTEGIATDEQLAIAAGKDGLGVFIRTLVGLDRAAAMRAFAAFQAERTLTANQHEFINLIIEHLTARGVVEPRLLYESPFTDIDPLGVAGVFSDADSREIIVILHEIRDNAAA